MNGHMLTRWRRYANEKEEDNVFLDQKSLDRDQEQDMEDTCETRDWTLTQGY